MEDARNRAGRVKLLLLDVDGVLTDGRIIYTSSGDELKFFDVRDGHGIKLLQRAGVKVGIITGRSSDLVARRASELGIEVVYQGQFNKVEALEEILADTGLSPEDVGYVGDDVVDLPVMRRVGFAASVADAHDLVKEAAHYVSPLPGGRGAVRDIVEFILRASGKWETVMSRYLS
ncbi:MAG: HAD-IIIA family hydrolase [Deltaproteobacteria bacterium]|nr:MAG: HAD-IIIA family hydrolase [Deltaproteobacteria bacterium]